MPIDQQKTEYTFEDGCMWEGGDWKIVIDYQCSENGGGKPCAHCHSEQVLVRTSAYGKIYTEHVWICPSVIIAKNEGGCNTTGVCLRCVIEAEKQITENDTLGGAKCFVDTNGN